MDTSTTARPVRLDSIDVYRGLVMFLMMAEILRLGAVAANVPDSPTWQFLAWCQTHVEWVGCSPHDLIQPSFSFLVGVSLPFSIAARASRGQSFFRMALHALWRAVLLTFLGILLRSSRGPLPDYGFTDTLSQIGMGYFFLFLLGFRPVRDQWLAVAAILVGYWAWFATSPLPPADFDWAAVGVKPEWLQQYGLTGFAAHWNKNANPATAFDVWFLNLFPRQSPFVFNSGGYAVLNFVPTLATMILGLIAGGVLKSDRSTAAKLTWFVAAGLIGLASGYALGWWDVCPVVKRIWTPSWVLYSGGWCFLILAAFHAVTDVAGWRRWAFPLIVIGTNSIAAYCLASAFVKPQIHDAVRRFGDYRLFGAFGEAYVPLVHGSVTLLVMWLILFWMYRRKLFLKV